MSRPDEVTVPAIVKKDLKAVSVALGVTVPAKFLKAFLIKAPEDVTVPENPLKTFSAKAPEEVTVPANARTFTARFAIAPEGETVPENIRPVIALRIAPVVVSDPK
jgi:hypothetical protein